MSFLDALVSGKPFKISVGNIYGDLSVDDMTALDFTTMDI